jgi:hypothetical protein
MRVKKDSCIVGKTAIDEMPRLAREHNESHRFTTEQAEILSDKMKMAQLFLETILLI